MGGGRSNHSNPEEYLSDLIFARLDVRIAPDKIGAFIRSHWQQIQSAAHQIHAGEPARK